MSSDVAIRVKNLSKCYQLYDRPQDHLKQPIVSRLRRLLGLNPINYFREFWALRNISFDVKKGQTIGIIGRNGSGKSTLLQLICGTLSPTEGDIEVNGRVAALLELGSGFNSDFTGRENVYLNGSVLGLTKEEIDAKFDEISAFADIGGFIDQPIKTYSSGMMVRLAFAVAINIDPQIIVIDEALSVGDELFQRKCFSKIEEIRNNGTTILFVSHSSSTVIELCDRALMLDSGELLVSGIPKDVVGKYQKLLYAQDEKRENIRNHIKTIRSSDEVDAYQERKTGKEKKGNIELNVHLSEEFFEPHLKPQSTLIYDSRGAIIESPQILSPDGDEVNCLKRGNTYRYTYIVRFNEIVNNVRFGMLIKTTNGQELGGSVSAPTLSQAVSRYMPGTIVRVEFLFDCMLNNGMYYLNAGVVGTINGEETYLHRILDAYLFRVLPVSFNTCTRMVDFNISSEVFDITQSKYVI